MNVKYEDDEKIRSFTRNILELKHIQMEDNSRDKIRFSNIFFRFNVKRNAFISLLFR